MSRRMNYGMRFGSPTAGGPTGYDPAQDPSTWNHPFSYAKKMDPIKRALVMGTIHSKTKAAKARVGKLPTGDPPPPKSKLRQEYEKEMGALITEVVHKLEQALEQLNKAPALTPQDTPLINRRQVMEAIHKLKLGFHRREGEVKNR